MRDAAISILRSCTQQKKIVGFSAYRSVVTEINKRLDGDRDRTSCNHRIVQYKSASVYLSVHLKTAIILLSSPMKKYNEKTITACVPQYLSEQS